MPSCERIPPADFHSHESREYTEQCVETLMETSSFQRYVRHIEYKERLSLTWFLAPIGLMAITYYHLIAFYDVTSLTPFDDKILSSDLSASSGLSYATLILLLYILPCVVIAPFTGFFEDLRRSDAIWLYLFFSSFNILLVSYGGPVLHHPPFLVTEPTIHWLSGTRSNFLSYLKVMVIRALPLQGYVTAGYTVAVWRQAFWRRAWHLPAPLLTLPVVVGIFGALFYRVCTLTLAHIMVQDATYPTTRLWPTSTARWEDISKVGFAWMALAESVIAVVRKDVSQAIAQGSLSALLHSTESCGSLYVSSLTLAVGYFFAVLMRPIACFLLDAILALLPTHPTTWGLGFVSSVAAFVALLQIDDCSLGPLLALVSIAFALLLNGFVA